jgi:phage FluMu protein Com
LNDNATPSAVRCPRCARLLARRLASGALEVRHGDRSSTLVIAGEVRCSRCAVVVTVTGVAESLAVVMKAS